jgi:tetratricopeptide (TPR) repeat protein
LIYTDARDFSRAEQIARRAVELAPDSPSMQAFYRLGRALSLQGRLDESEEVHERALEHYPYDDLNRIGRARVELLRGDPAAAERTAREILSNGPSGTANLLLVYTLSEQGRYDAAAKVAREIASRDPRRESQAALAWTLVAGELDLDEGVALAERALGLRESPHASAYVESYVAPPRHSLGLAYLKRGDYERAAAMLSTATSENPERASIRRHLEQARAKLAD